MPISSALSSDNKTMTITISGRFDFSTNQDFRHAMAKDPPGEQYVVDLGRADYLDSAALGMLLLLKEKADSSRVGLVVSHAHGQPKQALEVACFDKLITIS